jgi:ribokinase
LYNFLKDSINIKHQEACSMKILVFGSINMDLTTYSEKLPQPGETLHGTSYITVPGGKGLNQAVACTRMGAELAMVGRVGDDSFGKEVLDLIAKENIDISQITIDKEAGTGLATINVDKNAENVIIVIPGANHTLDSSDVDRAEKLLGDTDILMLQLEVSLKPTYEIARIAKDKGVKVVFDPAPARSIPENVFGLVDFITPNEIETEQLVGIKPTSPDEAAIAASKLREKGADCVIIKLGAQGAYYDLGKEKGFIPAFSVDAIDTVAAGDAFNAGLAVAIAEGKDIPEAVRWGAAAGAIATTRKGALPAMPYREELIKLLKE